MVAFHFSGWPGCNLSLKDSHFTVKFLFVQGTLTLWLER